MHHQRLAEKSVHLPRIDHVAHFHLSRLSQWLNNAWALGFPSKGAGHQCLHYQNSWILLSHQKWCWILDRTYWGRSKASQGLCFRTLWPTAETVTSIGWNHQPPEEFHLTSLRPPPQPCRARPAASFCPLGLCNASSILSSPVLPLPPVLSRNATCLTWTVYGKKRSATSPTSTRVPLKPSLTPKSHLSATLNRSSSPQKFFPNPHCPVEGQIGSLRSVCRQIGFVWPTRCV